MSQRIVIDTNVYVSRFLKPSSIPGLAVVKALREGKTLISTATWMELREVLQRPKFARFIKPGLMEPYLADVWNAAEQIIVSTPIHACRDPKDDKFLEVAVHGKAGAIVTGDQDLLVLNPFRGIAILTPRAYLELQ
jgi:putative PIN family toxin of toxin-antitoxin system